MATTTQWLNGNYTFTKVTIVTAATGRSDYSRDGSISRFNTAVTGPNAHTLSFAALDFVVSGGTSVAIAPTIATQPASQSVNVGGSASFSVTANGTAPLTYQWSKNGSVVSGATGVTLSLSNVQSGDAGSYTVIVTNTAGSATSSAATLTVNSAATVPTITTQPTSQSVTVGATATFSVAASGTGSLTYQWSKNGSVVSGATGATLSLSNVQSGDAGSYTAVVTNSAGSVTSNAASLIVSTSASGPNIATQPESLTVTAGGSAAFTVVASGTAPLSYQWSKNGAAIVGATGSTFALSSSQLSDAGSYSVVVSNATGSVTSTVATLTVNASASGSGPLITVQPTNQTATVGFLAQFSVTATPFLGLTYQWYKNGSAISGATSFLYTVNTVTSVDAGAYTVIVSNGVGSVTSAAATLTVIGAGGLAPTISVQPADQRVAVGFLTFLGVTASGAQPLTYQWYKNGTAVSGANTIFFTVSSSQPSDAGSYSVIVSNSAGSVTSAAATVLVGTAPTISTQPVSQSVTLGQSISFSAVASGTAPFTYQWRKDGVSIGGATSAALTLNNVQYNSAGSYTVVVANSAGSVTSNAASLAVNAPVTAPTITIQPVAVSIVAGGIAAFTVTASGTAPLGYQWLKNGTPIVGATNSTLTLPNVQSADAASYTVTVTNAVGSVTSSAAALTLVAPRISGVSVRTTLAAEQILIVGVNVAGGSKLALIRAAGPGLGAFGVPGTMADPKLALFNGQTQIAANDNWAGNAAVAAANAALGAFPFPSSASLDAALVSNIDGGRTVQVSGPTAGNLIVEVYDAGSGDTPRLTSVSALNRVGTGGDILIAGFTLTGSGTRNLLIRGVGPSLGALGVPAVLDDPKIELFSAAAVPLQIGGNDNYASSLAPVFASVGSFALVPGGKDAAFTVSLPAGGNTVQVAGADGGTGTAIVEIYELP